MAASRTLTIKFVGDSKNAVRSVKDMVSEMDKTESAGKKVATAMKLLSSDAESAFADAKDAADKLARALGDDTVAEIKAAGRSVEGYIGDLQRMGLSYDDVRTDVGELADAIRQVESTKSSLDSVKLSTTDLGNEAKIAAGKIDTVRDSGDQSRAVLGSMVGGSAADLAGLGGVAGTLASTLDQMTSYAIEGQFNLKSLAQIAGPMAGVGVAVLGVSWAMGKLKENSEKVKHEAELMLGVQEQLRDGKFEEAGAALAEEYGKLAVELENMGVPQDEVMRFILGASDEMPTFNRLLEDNKIHFAEGGVGLTDFGGKLNDLGGDVYDAKRAFDSQEEALTATDQATQLFTDALIGAAREAGDTEIAIKDLEAAYKELTGELSNEEGWLNMTESMIQFRADMASGELSVLEQKQALVDVKGSLIDYLTSLEDVPASKQTEIMALIDQGDVDAASRQLDILARARGVQVYIAGGMGNGLKYSAHGNPLRSGEPSVVGDNPDGSWNSTTELFVPSVSGRILSASDSRAAVGGNGGVTNVFNITAGPLASPADIGRAVREALLADARASGPVFATVRS